MEYRQNKRTGDKISVIGLGTAYMSEASEKDAIKLIRHAYEGGINYFDLAGDDACLFPYFYKALHDVRENVYYQIHFGANYLNGEYGWTTDLETIKKSVQYQLESLHTDYIDYGFIHCQDEYKDWQEYKANGVLDYIYELKEKGIIHHIGLSSHTPSVINTILDEVDIDMLMFSINPAYDYGDGEFAYGSKEERDNLYQRCLKEGIGISVMKPFSGGVLLDELLTPFTKALSIHQCLSYVLDTPSVLVALPGAHTVEEVDTLLSYHYEEYKDSIKEKRKTGTGCTYCDHCLPCPAGIDIGLVNKYYDLIKVGDTLALEHYRSLEKNADDCIQCGHCDNRCPFKVKQTERMKDIQEYLKSAN